MTKKIALACSVCGNRNYTLKKAPSKDKRMVLNKFCKHCQSHTVHKETM